MKKTSLILVFALFTMVSFCQTRINNGLIIGRKTGNLTGNYVASSTGFNGVGLYTANGTTLTAVAQSTNDKAHLTTPAYEGKNIPFITPYQANPGVYWVAIYYNMNSTTVVPQMIATTSFYAHHGNLYKAVSTGSYVFVSAKKANVATFQSTFTITTLTGDNVTYFVAPY